jgi:hypothetical protein
VGIGAVQGKASNGSDWPSIQERKEKKGQLAAILSKLAAGRVDWLPVPHLGNPATVFLEKKVALTPEYRLFQYSRHQAEVCCATIRRLKKGTR